MWMRCLYVAGFCLPISSYAFFCPTNFNQINLGYSIEQIQQTCGKPDRIETKEVEPLVPQEWNYYIPQSVMLSANQLGQGTLKTSVAFDKNGKAINISVNGIGVGATTICNNRNIQLGDTREAIKTACGEPSFITRQSNPDTGTPPKKIQVTTFFYNSTPPQQLIFKDGKLTSHQ